MGVRVLRADERGCCRGGVSVAPPVFVVVGGFVVGVFGVAVDGASAAAAAGTRGFDDVFAFALADELDFAWVVVVRGEALDHGGGGAARLGDAWGLARDIHGFAAADGVGVVVVGAALGVVGAVVEVAGGAPVVTVPAAFVEALVACVRDFDDPVAGGVVAFPAHRGREDEHLVVEDDGHCCGVLVGRVMRCGVVYWGS